MKRIYLQPQMAIVKMNTSHKLLAGSGGVTTNSTLGNDYNSQDVSYSRESTGGWFDEE